MTSLSDFCSLRQSSVHVVEDRFVTALTVCTTCVSIQYRGGCVHTGNVADITVVGTAAAGGLKESFGVRPLGFEL